VLIAYVLAVIAILFVAAAIATRDEDFFADAPPDAPDLGLPAGQVQPEDVAEVRFGLALRGYRMSEVDEVLERLAGELAARDARVTRLEQALVDVVEPELERVEAALGVAPDEGWAPIEEPPAADPWPPAAGSGAAPVAASVSAAEADAMPAPVAGLTEELTPSGGAADAVAEPEPLVAGDDGAFSAGEAELPGPAGTAAASDGELDDFFPEVLAPDRAPEGVPEAADTAPESPSWFTPEPFDVPPLAESPSTAAPSEAQPIYSHPSYAHPSSARPTPDQPADVEPSSHELSDPTPTSEESASHLAQVPADEPLPGPVSSEQWLAEQWSSPPPGPASPFDDPTPLRDDAANLEDPAPPLGTPGEGAAGAADDDATGGRPAPA
jgi:DivIVA domain-containing protein